MPLATLPSLTPALPEIFLAIAAMLLLMLGVFSSEENNTRMVSYASVLVLIVAVPFVGLVTEGRSVTFGGAFVTDTFAVYIKALVLVSAATVIIMSKDYVIASFQRDSARSAEAGLKYFVLGALASGLLLYGMSMIYGFAGTTSFDTLARIFHDSHNHVSVGVVVGIVFMLAGLAFKVSAVPFHMWTPDVYEGAPTPVTALFAVAPKIAAMGLFIRVMIGPFGELGAQWQQIIIFISIASMLLGAFAAINQTNIKRLMAYSSIGHMGYALIGLAVAGAAGDATLRADGVESMLIYLGIYMVMNIGTFACILLMKRDGRMVEGIDDLVGLSKSNPALAMILSIFMFSMAGIPPLAGFLGKLYVFQAAIQVELYALAIIGVLASVVGAYYYIRIIKVMYFDDPVDELDRGISLEMKTILVVTGVVIIFFVFYPAPLLTGAESATAALFHE